MPIAVVGIGCRFPGGVHDVASFWRLLTDGTDAIEEIPPDRIDLAHYFDERPATPGRIMTRWGGFLRDIESFDAGFFGISPREAERLDPAQRLVLETAWEGLEDAGIDALKLDGSPTGVFVGQWLSDFEARLFADPEAVDFYMTTGSGRYATSGRLSYLLGLRGPSLTLDTACSSSLVAVHLAVQSLRAGECQLALAGGVNVILQPHISVAYSQSRMMAPDGRCKFGDASGDGYVRSEGAGMVVLKPLAAAQADGDRIYAVIRGSAVNNDGHSSGSMGTPSREGQEALLRTAYADAGVAPGTVGYVEAHGTGTRAGDPVELGALGAVLAAGRGAGARARVGSVKTNLGHTEGAAGVAGLIKVALALHHGRIPASLHCREPNPAVDWANAPFEIARGATEWPGAGRVGGVSAFGIAGTNAHVVLQAHAGAGSATAAEAPPASGRALLALSARSPEALRALAARHADALEGAAPGALHGHAAAAVRHRMAMPERAAFAAAERDEMIRQLRAHAAGDAAPAEGRAPAGASGRLAFVVPGQGGQWTGMARGLLAHCESFRSTLQRCDDAARRWMDASIVEQLQLEPEAPGYRLDRIEVIQPTLVALAIAYAETLRTLGIEADAVVGHSMGEVAAACIAGALSLDDAMRIVCRRSALMASTRGQGAMALVELSSEQARERIAGHEAELAVAVSNSPRSCVLSGAPEALERVMAELERDQVFARLVKVDVASHSPQMQPLAEALAQELHDLAPSAPRRPMYSTVLAERVDGAQLGAAYWAANLRQPVRFMETVQALLAEGVTAFVELGPHPVLLPALQQTAQAAQVPALTVPCERRDAPQAPDLLLTLGGLWAGGHAVDWPRVLPAASGPAALPLYPWQRERLWHPAAGPRVASARGPLRHDGAGPVHSLLGVPTPIGGDPPGLLWEPTLRLAWAPHLGDHRLHGVAMLAASAYLDMALAAARAAGGPGAAHAPLALQDLRFELALPLRSDAPPGLQLVAEPDAGVHRLRWHSHGPQGWLRHAQARLSAPAGQHDDAPAFMPSTGEPIGTEAFYAALEQRGVVFGATLQSIAEARLGPGLATAQLQRPVADTSANLNLVAPPWALDACFQLAVAALPGPELWIPQSIAAVRWAGSSALPQRVQVSQRHGADGTRAQVDVTLWSEDGVLLLLQGMQLLHLAGQRALAPQQMLLQPQWAAEPLPVAATAPGGGAVIVADATGLAPALAEAWQAQGRTVALVEGPDDLAQALAGLASHACGRPIDIVLAQGLDIDASAPAASGPLAAAAKLLQQAARFDAAPRRCWLLTRGACAVLEADARALAGAQAGLAALAATAGTELPHLWGGHLDLDPARPAAAQAAEVVAALAAGPAGEAALRAGQRHVSQLAALPATAAPAAGVALRADATVLLTGGLGGVGAQVARWLIEQGARHLLVLGRTALPERCSWRALSAESAAGRSTRTVRQLEALGASIHYASVDVADRQALEASLQAFEAEGWPPVRSVVHAAGATDDRLLLDLDEASIDRVLSGKAGGAAHLDALLPDLDHFILFSSVAALLPQPGQAAYAAANAFLDALAHRRHTRGQPALSLNWGVWQGLGFADTAGGKQALAQLARQGLGGFDAADGLQALRHALSSGQAQLAVLPVDPAALQRAIESGGLPPAAAARLRGLAAAPGAPTSDGDTTSAGWLAKLLGEPEPQRRARLEERLAQQAAGVLRLPAARLDHRTPLGSYGLSSLMALELRNVIEGELGLPLSATVLWNYPTISALAEHLLSKLAAAAPSAAPAADVPASAGAPTADAAIDEMSDDEALALLIGQRRGARRSS